MTRTDLPLPQGRFGSTMRKDAWWLQPAAVFLGLLAFVVYSTWAALQGDHYFFAGQGAQYLSPFYSPVLWDSAGLTSGHAWLGPMPSWWPPWLLFSPAFLILWAPGGFRLTCYYYRGAYYKAFWADPPSCAVGEPRTGYRGEQLWPLRVQNIHRFFLYLALIFILILASDAWRAMWFLGEDGQKHPGVGVGTIVLTLNVVFLGGYTLGCHSLRHLIGGRIDALSRHRVRTTCYTCVSCLNRRHMFWAWASLFWVGFSDVYVRLCSMGVWSDWRLF